MPSALDLRVIQAIDDLTQPGGPLALTTHKAGGVELPMIATAPSNLVAYFDHFCAQHADAIFIVAGDERLTFREVHAAACRIAAVLVGSYKVRRGDRVGIAMRNAPSWVVLYMGVLMAGGIATLLNGWWQGGELCDGIDATGAKLVFADPPRAARIRDCERELGFDVVQLDIALPLEQALEPVLSRGDAGGLPVLDGDDLATILFTSGSTGQSKGAYSTHRAVVQGVFNYIAMALMMLRIGTEDGTIREPRPQHAILMTVPLFHVTGEIPMLLVSFAIGRKMVMMPKWDAVEAMRLIEAEKVTNFTGVPLMSYEILSHPDRAKYDLSTVQSFAAGGAPRPPEHVRRMRDEMPAPPALGYGLTETNAVGCGSFSDNYAAKPNSTGAASRPLVDLAILDDAGKPVAQGERGEVSIRTVCNFSGYWNNAAATRACMTDDGYFRTGDIGYLDEDDYLFIVDRKKDIIIRGGENISCQEVEAALYEHPAVAEAAVFGLPDERLGEIPGAVVHLHGDDHVSEEAIKFFVGERLAAFKVPARIWVSEELLPKLGTEKIDKVGLRLRYRDVFAREVLV